MRRSLTAAAAALLAATPVTAFTAGAQPAAAQAPSPAHQPVSVTPTGEWANGTSAASSIDGDGDVVAFTSDATDLVAETATLRRENRAFVRDVTAGATELVSRSVTAEPVPGASGPMSADGRHVAFTAIEDDVLGNGAPRDRLGVPIVDAFVLDRDTGEVHHVSTLPDGTDPLGSSYVAGLSDDGRFVAVASADGSGTRTMSPVMTMYVVDLVSGTRTLVNRGQASVGRCDLLTLLGLSGDGRRVVLGGCGAVVVDLGTGERRLVPFSNRIPQVAAPDGRFVAAGELLSDAETGLVRRVPLPPVDARGRVEPDPEQPVVDVAPGGRFALVHDPQGTLVWRDLAAARSVPVAGASASGSISDDGRWVAWSALGQVQLWGPAPIAPPAPATTEGWVRWLYAHALNRLPASTDAAYWAGQLRSGAPASRIAAAIQRSPEGLARWGAILAARVPGAASGDDERARRQLAAGVPSVDVSVDVVLTVGARHGWQAWDHVRVAYDTFLGRYGRDDEVEGWVQEVNRGVPLRTVVRAIAQSHEGRQHRVFHLYLDVLRRTPDAGGLRYWTARLADSDDLALRIDLLASAELRVRPAP